jgi:hypothetical protein
MRIHVTAAAIAALATLTACSTSQAADYTVANRAQQGGTGSADLILPHADQGQARTAIRDYAGSIHGVDLYYLKVMRSTDATRYVCRARWYRDAQSFQAHAAGQAVPSIWPHLAVNCP